MIPQVASIDEAQDFFLTNSSGECLCVDGDRTQVCRSFPEAKAFFAKNSPAD